MPDLSKLAKLSKLEIDENQKDVLEAQLNELVEFASRLSALTLPEIPEEEVYYGKETLRKDIALFPSRTEEILSNAPAVKDGYFFVPQVMAKEEEA